MSKKYILPVILLILMLSVYLGYHLIYLAPPNTALKVDKIKISNVLYDEVNADYNDETLTNKYFVDTIILSEIAIEIGLDETLEVNSNKVPFETRKALVNLLERHYKDIHVAEEDKIKEIYEQRYETIYEYIAIDTRKELDEIVQMDLSDFKTSQGTVNDFHMLHIPAPLVDRWYVLPENGVTNRYVFVSKELPKEKTYEDAKLEIESELKEVFAKSTVEKLLDQSYLKYKIYYYRASEEK